MAANGLGCLIMTAVIDQGFRERLVAAPTEVVGDFELTTDEQEALTSIQAASFTEFAARLHQWLERRDPLRLGRQQDEDMLVYQTDGLPEVPGGVDDFSRAASMRQSPGLPVWRPLCQEMSQVVRPRVTIGKGMNSPCPEAYMASRT